MKQVVILYLILLVMCSNAFAQKINFSEIDASKYPMVNTSFSAFDGLGNFYTNIVKSDFQVVDNGLTLSPNSIDLECSTNMPVNVVLVLDKSSSMNAVFGGETLWQWVKEGATTFINTFKFSDSAKVAIIAFSGSNKLICNFTSNKLELIDSLMKIPVANGATNFNEPFFSSGTGALDLLATRPGNHRRAIVFLTDGVHETQITLRSQDIINSMNELNIRFFGISLMSDPNSDLGFWSQQTGGKSKTINSKADLNNIYETFAKDLKETILCKLIWKSPDICDLSETYRKADIKFIPLDVITSRNYQAPDSNIVSVQTDKINYDFGDPALGATTDREIIIKPKNKEFFVSKMSIVPKDYFEIIDWGDGSGNMPNFPFVIPMDTERKIKVRYKPFGIRKYRQATLMLEGEPCPKEIQLIGGFQQVVLDKPVNGDVNSRCDTINIEWSGIPKNILVDLTYSTDYGVTWYPIVSGVSGGIYKWFPDISLPNIKIKVKISDQFGYDFINSAGGAGNEFSTSVTVQPNGLYNLVSGYFSGKIDFGDLSKTSLGKYDFFVAKFDLDGNPVWLNTGGSVGQDDKANGVAVDNRGFVYVTGYTYQGIRYGNISPSLEIADSKYLYLAKYSPAGQYLHSVYIGATGEYNNFKAEGIKIKSISQLGVQNKIAVIGSYEGYFVEFKTNTTLPETPAGTEYNFTAIFDENLNLLEMHPEITLFGGFSDTTFTDKNTKTRYDVGSYSGTKNVAGKELTSRGLSDIWITKYARNPVSEFVCNQFDNIRPIASFIPPEYNFGDVVYGDEVTQTATAILKNTGKLPFMITGHSIKDFAGDPIPDFVLKTVIDSVVVLQPDSSIDLELWFKPGSLGERKAILSVSGVCAADISLVLKGNGICGGTALEMHDFGNVNLNKIKYDTVICVYKNISETPTFINPGIRGTNNSDFKIILPDYVKEKQVNGIIKVYKDECIDLIVVFEPKGLGLREAYIRFFVSSPCKESYTNLKGIGITSDIGITSYNWNDKRIKGTYNGEIEIINNSNVTEKVKNIQYDNGNPGNIFTVENKTMPFDLPANGSVKLAVTFNPKDEQSYSENLLVSIESREAPLISTLTGNGILPKLVTTWTCGEKVNVGETAQASVTLTNPSTTSELKINSIKIQNNDEFVFPSGTVTSDLIIAKESYITLPVLFTPVTNGDNADNFIILADDYDGTFTDEWKETTVPILCDGLEVDITSPVDFGTLLVCEAKTMPVSITNKSTGTDLVLYLSQITLLNNSNGFVLPSLQDVTVKGGETYTFDMTFTPNSPGQYSNSLFIPNSMSQAPFLVELKGESVNIPLTTDKNEVTLMVGERFTFNLNAELPKTSSGLINMMKIRFKADANVISFIENSFKSKIPAGTNWVWSIPVEVSSGYYEITGNGELSDNKTVSLFSADFIGLLNDKLETRIVTDIDYGCYKESFNLTVINTKEICMNDTRMVLMNSINKFRIETPNPNPAYQIIELKFGVGFDVDTKIDIVNYFGETVKIIHNGMLKSGTYMQAVSTTELSSGTYMIRMTAGPFTDTKTLQIVK